MFIQTSRGNPSGYINHLPPDVRVSHMSRYQFHKSVSCFASPTSVSASAVVGGGLVAGWWRVGGGLVAGW